MAPRKPTTEAGEPVDAATGEILAKAKEVFNPEVVFNEMTLAAKLCWVMAHLPEMKQEGRNTHFGYNFIKDTQISSAVRSLFSQCGIAMIVREVREHTLLETKTAKGGTSYLTQIIVGFRLVNAHDASDYLDGEGIGYGDDSGDKGANKAMTAATKYWLMKTLAIGGEDLEDDAAADTRADERQQSPRGDKPVKVEDSAIEGIERGGKSNSITEAQLREIGGLMRQNGMNAVDGVSFLARTFGLPVTEVDPAEAGASLRAMLTSMTSDAAGTLIQKLDALARETGDASGAIGDEAP